MRHAPSPAACLGTLLATSLLLVAAAPPPRGARPPAPAPTHRYTERLEVVETSVLAVLPAGVHGARSPADWLVRENGADRPVERVEAVNEEPWQVLIWVDGPLCRQESLARTMLALAFQAETLTRQAAVRVVVADPEPHVELAPTREPRAVVETLARISSQQVCTHEPAALLWRARGFSTPPRQVQGMTMATSPANPTLPGASSAMQELRTLVERRADAIAAGAGSCPAAACALFLVAEGYPLEPDVRLPVPVRAAAGPELRQALASGTDGLARRLVLGHWLLVALPFAPPPPPDEPSEAEQPLPKEARPGPEPFPADPGDHGPPGAPSFGGRQPATAPPARAYDVYTDPELEPLRRVSELTAGAIVRVPDQLPAVLRALRDRRWVWYRTTSFAPGEVRTLEVLAGRPPRRAMAPAWIGAPASTPVPAPKPPA